jgi:hypothetical protein
VNLRDTLVVLDTCVLLKARVSDVLMDLRAEGVFSAHWTENIADEFLRSLQAIYKLPQDRAVNRLRAMQARCPEWEVHMSRADFDAVPAKVHPKDRHVAAAALALRHAADKDTEADEPGQRYDVVLLTDNIRDFDKRLMGRAGVRVLGPGAFLDEAYNAESDATTRAVMQAVKDLKKPPYTLAELLFVLREQGARTLVSRMSKALGVVPVDKAVTAARDGHSPKRGRGPAQ